MIDLSRLNKVEVNASRRVANAGAGLRLGELDKATSAVGLATPLGIVSNTGIAGLTLGGKNLSKKAVEIIVDFMGRVPSPFSAVALQQMHGQAARTPSSACAFAHRAEPYDMGILSQCSDAGDTEKNISWTRELWEHLRPYLERATYVNSLGEERVRAAYGANYERLKSFKAKYDSDNFFCLNQNINPGQVRSRH